jgi:general stress protein 26
MTSIHENQPEKNHEDLQGPKAVAKIRELVDKAETCFFRTDGARPMNVRRVDDRGRLWFLAANDAHWVQEMGAGGPAELFFQGSPHSDFLHLGGRATLSRDKARIEELWDPTLNTWFTEGQDDPRITVIAFEPTEGYYWDHKHGGLVAGVKMLIGAAVGKTLDDTIEGKIQV